MLIQGITGREGSFHTAQMRAFGTNIVAGVSPGKGGSDQDGVPIFDTVADAVAATGADVSGIFVPPAFAADAIMESAAAGIELTVCITELIPVHDMIRARDFVIRTGHQLLGANCPGIVTPGQCKVGIIPNHINTPGTGGDRRPQRDAHLRGDPGTRSGGDGPDDVGRHRRRPGDGPELSRCAAASSPTTRETRAVVLIGEIGGSDEETAAAWIRETGFDKPVVAFISGRTAPPGKRMGHAGAIISGNTGSAQSKLDALTAAGADIADTIEDVVRLTAARLGTHSR